MTRNLPPSLIIEVLQQLLPEGYVIAAPGEGPDEPMNEASASAWLQTTPRVLRRLRTSGEGPVYRKVGREPVYLKSDLEAWLRDRPALHSTAEYRHAG
jgi:hypothetical protein